MKGFYIQLSLLLFFQASITSLFSQVVRVGGGGAINISNLINGSVIYTNASHSSKTNRLYAGGGIFATCNVKPLKGNVSPLFAIDLGFNYIRYGQYYDIIHPTGLMNEQIRKQTWFDKTIHSFSTNFKIGLDYRNAYFLTGVGIEIPIKGVVNYSVAVDGGQKQFNRYNLQQTGKNNFKTTAYWLLETGYNFNLKKSVVLTTFINYKLLLSPLDRTETYYFPVYGRISQTAIGISITYSLKLKSKTK